ncbi:MAG TPA: mechanosensitive ion channel family protein [Xanthomonadales bacterium]|nr:mechanosensitive ion channel family protein [Xanthomonadales bacterium]
MSNSLMEISGAFNHQLKQCTRLSLVLLSLWLGLLFAPACLAQSTDNAAAAADSEHVAMVQVDGIELFPLRGVSAFPAKARAALVQKRIVAFAKDPNLAVADLEIVASADSHLIRSSQGDIVNLFDIDAELEGINRDLLSKVYLRRISDAVEKFRHDRTPSVLGKNALYALGVILLSTILLWAVVRLFRWLDGLATRHVQRNIDMLASKSHQLFSGGQVWRLFAGFLRLLRILAIILLVYFLLNTVLGLFPWTRPLAMALFALVLNPIQSMALGLVSAIPDLAFLLILFLVVRYFLKIIRIFFRQVESGQVKLENFDNDWAMPTFKLLRIMIVAFAIVIAYPYIPGSDSMAFKGISVFLGVIFSLGSSSFISGMIAGLTMTYRGAFKEGDLVKIGDTMGIVTEIKLMITRIRTAKNEIVVIPNSNILNTNVVNYSTMAREKKLILHTIVGIGYDTPWRQVEALLLLAAERTEGLLKDPPAFVLQRELGDFAVNYELNAYYNNEHQILRIYSELHAHIQDVFNEYGVQIMSPAYEMDPREAKIVPKEQWYAAPAKSPE